MDKNRILTIISNIEKSLNELKIAFGDTQQQTTKVERKSKTKRQTGKESPTNILHLLIKKGFFSVLRTGQEVQKELRKSAIKIKYSSLTVTLMRFVKKEILMRDGEGTSKNPWKYKVV